MASTKRKNYKKTKKDSSKKKLRKKKNLSCVIDYGRYIYKVNKKVNRNLKLSQKSILILNSFLNDIFQRIVKEAKTLIQIQNLKTLFSRQLKYGTCLVLPTTLYKIAAEEGRKALNRYHSSKTASIPQNCVEMAKKSVDDEVWYKCYSIKSKRIYYWNVKTHKSVFEDQAQDLLRKPNIEIIDKTDAMKNGETPVYKPPKEIETRTTNKINGNTTPQAHNSSGQNLNTESDEDDDLSSEMMSAFFESSRSHSIFSLSQVTVAEDDKRDFPIGGFKRRHSDTVPKLALTESERRRSAEIPPSKTLSNIAPKIPTNHDRRNVNDETISLPARTGKTEETYALQDKLTNTGLAKPPYKKMFKTPIQDRKMREREELLRQRKEKELAFKKLNQKNLPDLVTESVGARSPIPSCSSSSEDSKMQMATKLALPHHKVSNIPPDHSKRVSDDNWVNKVWESPPPVLAGTVDVQSPPSAGGLRPPSASGLRPPSAGGSRPPLLPTPPFPPRLSLLQQVQANTSNTNGPTPTNPPHILRRAIRGNRNLPKERNNKKGDSSRAQETGSSQPTSAAPSRFRIPKRIVKTDSPKENNQLKFVLAQETDSSPLNNNPSAVYSGPMIPRRIVKSENSKNQNSRLNLGPNSAQVESPGQLIKPSPVSSHRQIPCRIVKGENSNENSKSNTVQVRDLTPVNTTTPKDFHHPCIPRRTMLTGNSPVESNQVTLDPAHSPSVGQATDTSTIPSGSKVTRRIPKNRISLEDYKQLKLNSGPQPLKNEFKDPSGLLPQNPKSGMKRSKPIEEINRMELDYASESTDVKRQRLANETCEAATATSTSTGPTSAPSSATFDARQVLQRRQSLQKANINNPSCSNQEDDMEWEPIQPAEATNQQNNEQIKRKGNVKERLGQPRLVDATSRIMSNLSFKPLVIVIDTNALIHHIGLVEELVDGGGLFMGLPVKPVIPYQVFRELDNLKNNSPGAREANRLINECVRSPQSFNLTIQHREKHREKFKKEFELEKSDDYILNCALQEKECQGDKANVLLMTADLNLETAAKLEKGIHAEPPTKLKGWIREYKERVRLATLGLSTAHPDNSTILSGNDSHPGQSTPDSQMEIDSEPSSLTPKSTYVSTKPISWTEYFTEELKKDLLQFLIYVIEKGNERIYGEHKRFAKQPRRGSTLIACLGDVVLRWNALTEKSMSPNTHNNIKNIIELVKKLNKGADEFTESDMRNLFLSCQELVSEFKGLYDSADGFSARLGEMMEEWENKSAENSRMDNASACEEDDELQPAFLCLQNIYTRMQADFKMLQEGVNINDPNNKKRLQAFLTTVKNVFWILFNPLEDRDSLTVNHEYILDFLRHTTVFQAVNGELCTFDLTPDNILALFQNDNLSMRVQSLLDNIRKLRDDTMELLDDSSDSDIDFD